MFPERYQARICVTAQHREMLDRALDPFGVTPDFDLNAMTPGQTLFQSTSKILAALEPVFADAEPDLAIVQGDTTTTLCGALAAFYSGVPIAHVEAGLRTGDFSQPFPEELNRVLTSRVATLHFAPTKGAAENLAREGILDRVSITGNTGIDAALYVRDRLDRGEIESSSAGYAHPGENLILLTAHRRESFGHGFERICSAVSVLASRPDVRVVYPVHPNPNVRNVVKKYLDSNPHVTLVEPMDYAPFIDLMRRAKLILTDSGGIQEEAPSLGKPVLVLREKTERPEAVEAGTVKLTGTDPDRIVSEAARLLDDAVEYDRMSKIHNPYGDGHACERIEAILRTFFGE